MKCPKCSYHSFEHLDRCKKCGGDLREHKSRFGLAGLPPVVRSAAAGGAGGRAVDPIEAKAAASRAIDPADSTGDAGADRPAAVDEPAHAVEWSFLAEEQPATLADLTTPSTVPTSRRLVAAVIDLLILGLACMAFVAAGEFFLSPAVGGLSLPNLPTLLDLSIPYFLVFFILAFGYFTLFHFLTGQTPGKMALQIRVEATGGASLLFSQAFLRSVGGLLSLSAAGAGFLNIVFDSERRGWNDRLAGSRVVSAACLGQTAASEVEPA